jgi:opacity protein-like surface antigen
MINQKWVAALVVLAGVGVSGTALAEPPATANVLQIGAGFRYGFEMEEGDLNPWGPGLGLAVGYTLPNAVYLGGNFDYFFGDSIEAPGTELSVNLWQLMAEGGYDLGLVNGFVLRPKLGVGLASVHSEICTTIGTSESCESDSQSDFAIAPGVSFLYLGPVISLSVDLRYDMIFADEETGNALILSAGIGF